jgi:hypothetical protein
MIWYPKDFLPLSVYIVSAPLVLIFLFPYIQAEVQTAVNSKEFSPTKYCKKNKQYELKELKIIYIEKYKGVAKIYCLYEETQLNYSVNLYYADDKWFVEQNRVLSEGLYWPIYY